MHYAIYSSDGNMLDSFDDASDARRAVNHLVREEPDAVDHVAVVVYDAEGEPTGETLLPDDPTVAHADVRGLAGVGITVAMTTGVRSFVSGSTQFVTGPAGIPESGPWEPARTEASLPAVAIES